MEPGVPGGCTVQPYLWGLHHCTCSGSPALDPAHGPQSHLSTVCPGLRLPVSLSSTGPLRMSVLCPTSPFLLPRPGCPWLSAQLGLQDACKHLAPNSLLPECTVLVPPVASRAVALNPENTTRAACRWQMRPPLRHGPGSFPLLRPPSSLSFRWRHGPSVASSPQPPWRALFPPCSLCPRHRPSAATARSLPSPWCRLLPPLPPEAGRASGWHRDPPRRCGCPCCPGPWTEGGQRVCVRDCTCMCV